MSSCFELLRDMLNRIGALQRRSFGWFHDKYHRQSKCDKSSLKNAHPSTWSRWCGAWRLLYSCGHCDVGANRQQQTQHVPRPQGISERHNQRLDASACCRPPLGCRATCCTRHMHMLHSDRVNTHCSTRHINMPNSVWNRAACTRSYTNPNAVRK